MRNLLSIVSYGMVMCLLFLVFHQGNSFSQVNQRSKKISLEKPIIVYSNTLELNQKDKAIAFEGKVKAETEGMVVDCQKMIVYYLDNPAGNNPNARSSRIDKIVATGDVVINRTDGGIARAGRAVFYQNEEKVVLTENPFVQQGPDFVEGQRITIFLNENRSIIEGGETKRVKATIFPNEEEGKK